MYSPIDIAKQLYQDHCDEAFEVALGRYLTAPNGIVIHAPNGFAMGWAVDFEGKHAWYVDTAVGRLKALVRLMPFKLPYIAFCRGAKDKRAKLRIYRTERLLRLVK